MYDSADLLWAQARERRDPWAAQSWLRDESLLTLAELNEQCLELICEQAAASSMEGCPPLISQLEALWHGLDAVSRRRAARCPFLLLDAGFASAGSFPWQPGKAVRDRDDCDGPEGFFTVARTVPLTRLVLTYAWHLARSENAAARLFLGMSAQSADRMAGCTLSQVVSVAEREPRMLLPRWRGRPAVWRELLNAAASAKGEAMDRFCARGLQLLAAEVLVAASSCDYVE